MKGRHLRDPSSSCSYQEQSVEKQKRSQPDNVSEKRTRRRQRRITFSDSASVFMILNRNDLSDIEKESMFYRPKDIESFKTQIKMAVRKFDKSGCCANTIPHGSYYIYDYNSFTVEQECKLGLEGFTAKGSRQRSTAVTTAIDAVLDEQELQYVDGKGNAEMLAMIYKMYTKNSTLAAQTRAKSLLS